MTGVQYRFVLGERGNDVAWPALVAFPVLGDAFDGKVVGLSCATGPNQLFG